MVLIPIAGVVVLFLVYEYVRSRRASTDEVAFVEAVGWDPAIDWRVAKPLAGSHTKRVLLHPVFVSGVLFTPLVLSAATSSQDNWRELSIGVALGLVPLGWMAIIATNLDALQPRRAGTTELFSTLPVAQPVRTASSLVTAIGAGAVAAALACGWVIWVAASRDGLRGSPEWREAAVGVLIVAGGACLGVAVARWLPHVGFGVLAVIATVVLQARFLDVVTWPWNRPAGDPLRFIAFFVQDPNVGATMLEVRPSGWHLLYLGGLVVMMAGVAFARDGFPRPVAALLAVGVLFAGGAGWMQTRPLSGPRADVMVHALVRPIDVQICDESADVRYCAYDEFVDDVPAWRVRVDATLAALPEAAVAGRGRLDVIQRPAPIVGDSNCAAVAFRDRLPINVADRVSVRELWPADGAVHPPFGEEAFPCSDREVDGFFLAVQTAAWATGLPPAAHDDNERCTASGQARAVIALWAGAAASPDGARTLRDVTDEGASADGRHITFPDWNGPPVWGVDFATADAAVALQLLDRPTGEVRVVLERAWGHWIDPTTATSQLANEFGITQIVGQPVSATCP